MEDITGAPIVYIERILNPMKIAAYVAKYIAKAPHAFGGCKRYWRSLDWIFDRAQWDEYKHRHDGNWVVNNFSLERLEKQLLNAGYGVTWQRADFIEARLE